MTDIDDTLAVIAELASHRASTRLFTSDDARAILDHIAAQAQRIADLDARASAAEKHVEALREKHTDKCCACAYDNPDDVCGLHAVMAERDAARGEVARLREALAGVANMTEWSIIEAATNNVRQAIKADIRRALRPAIAAGQHKDVTDAPPRKPQAAR